jgi:alpha-1,4-digalacturonate transport system permease protein
VATEVITRPKAQRAQGIRGFLLARQGGEWPTAGDALTYLTLIVGTFIMFAPVVWMALSSFKEAGELYKMPPALFPEHFTLNNYTEALDQFPFMVYLRNSLAVTGLSTVLTLIINSMAAFALSKYRFRGRNFLFMVILSTLVVPLAVIMIPVYVVIANLGMTNSLLGLIIPPAATPTGVFLLRQYMLTIPDELIEAARMDGASEWRIYWQVVLPLARPAMAVLAIFSVMWRWNDLLWPLIVTNRSELFTLQIGLASFQGANITQWQYILAMTVLSLIPMTLVFVFLQKYLVKGIATTGLNGA